MKTKWKAKETMKMSACSSPPSASHYLANLVPVPEPFVIAPQYSGCAAIWGDTALGQIQAGLRALHGLLEDIYVAGVETPEQLIPVDPARRVRGLKDEEFQAYSRLLFALGIYGELAGNGKRVVIKVDSSVLAGFCDRLHIKQYEPFLLALEKFGLEHLPSQPLLFRFPASPDLIPALVKFSQTCRPLTKKEINPPVEFLRADLRLLRTYYKKTRSVPLDLEEAVQRLDYEREADFIRVLDAWARSAGFQTELKCTGVQRSEFTARYRQPKPERVLFGYVVQSGQLRMHINFDKVEPILPYIPQTPGSFRDLFYKNCACRDCGACQDGPLELSLDGQLRRLCHHTYAYMNIDEVQTEHYQAIQLILKAQAEFLKVG